MLRLGWMLLIVLLAFACNKRPRRNIAFYSNIGQEPTTLNPITYTDAYSVAVFNYVYESMLDVDEDTYEWIPQLATKWEVSKDKTQFTFWLREGVKWHDGVELTAEDVEYSFDVNFDVKRWNNAHKQFSYESIKSVKAAGKYKVVATVKSKIYSNFDVVAGMRILPKHFYSQKKKKSFFNKNLMGTGPYKLIKYHRGNRIVLDRNENWWGRNDETYNKKWNFPKVVLRWTADETVALEMLKKGRYDYNGMQPETYMKKAVGKEWGKVVHKVKVKNKSPKGYCYLGMNMKDSVLKDKRVRKALYHLLNRKLMIEKFEYNMSVPAVGPIYPSSPYANNNLKPVEFDPQKALSLLNKAGWKDSNNDGVLDKNGKKLSITILEPSGSYIKYLTIFKEDASKAGVEIDIKQMEWNSFIKVVTDEKNFEMCRLCWSASVDWDPKQIWHSSSIKGGSNFISYSNPKVDKLIDKARFIFDRAERIKILSKVEKEIVDDVPYLFMAYQKYALYGYTDRILKERDTYNYTIGTSFWRFKESPTMKAE